MGYFFFFLTAVRIAAVTVAARRVAIAISAIAAHKRQNNRHRNTKRHKKYRIGGKGEIAKKLGGCLYLKGHSENKGKLKYHVVAEGGHERGPCV